MAPFYSRQYFILIFIVCSLFHSVISLHLANDSHVLFYAEVLSYSNPSGTAFNQTDVHSNRRCCDVDIDHPNDVTCMFNLCDPFFAICSGTYQDGQCSEVITIMDIMNSPINTNMFNNSQEYRLPIQKVDTDSKQKHALALLAVDKDRRFEYYLNDLLDYIPFSVQLPVQQSFWNTPFKIVSLCTKYTKAELKMKLFCEPNYYGDQCQNPGHPSPFNHGEFSSGLVQYVPDCREEGSLVVYFTNIENPYSNLYSTYELTNQLQSFMATEVCPIKTTSVAFKLGHVRYDPDSEELRVAFTALCDKMAVSFLKFTQVMVFLPEARLTSYFKATVKRANYVTTHSAKYIVMLSIVDFQNRDGIYFQTPSSSENPEKHNCSSEGCVPNFCIETYRNKGRCVNINNDIRSNSLHGCLGNLKGVSSTSSKEEHDIVAFQFNGNELDTLPDTWKALIYDNFIATSTKTNLSRPMIGIVEFDLSDIQIAKNAYSALPNRIENTTGTKVSMAMEVLIWCENESNCTALCNGASHCNVTDDICTKGSRNTSSTDYTCMYGECSSDGCSCQEGYSGRTCSIQITTCPNITTTSCTSGHCTKETINSTCSLSYTEHSLSCDQPIPECYNDAELNEYVERHVCDEYHNYTLTLDCSENPCLNNGICQVENNTFICICQDPYYGGSCHMKNDTECKDNPCKNGGSCFYFEDSYNCTCAEGFAGTHCENNTDDCQPNLCQNGATCEDLVNGYNCTCADGYDGQNCDHDINECDSDPCQNGAKCEDLENGFNCTCAAGFDGQNCDHDINECASNPCQNGATCEDLENGFNCTCAAGYDGQHCDHDINECDSNPCQDGASCEDLVNGYNCTCAAGYAGQNCDHNINECDSDPCQNGATCDDLVNGYNCACVDGFDGKNCDHDINECDSDPCQNGATCKDLVNGHNCTCAAGYDGQNCDHNINECASDPCQNGATCEDLVNGFNCTCAAGFDGQNCVHDINECDSNPCKNGARCEDLVNGYNCTCADGYDGQNCDHDINECDSNTCQNGATCEDLVNGYNCTCAAGYDGQNCDHDVNECNSNPCQNGARCEDLVKGYNCMCAAGFDGQNCDHNINECDSNPCQNGAKCEDLVNGYNCTCAAGFDGQTCDRDINECDSYPCQNGATCEDLVNGYNCTCAAGYDGQNCDHDINECDSDPCQNGATCEDIVNGYNCTCAAGYDGQNCDHGINECDSDPCQNGATCEDLVNGYNCTCAAGYDGQNCDNDINECDSDPCQNGATCKDLVNGYNCTCAAGYIDYNCEIMKYMCDLTTCYNGGSCYNTSRRLGCICASGYTGERCELKDSSSSCDSPPCQKIEVQVEVLLTVKNIDDLETAYSSVLSSMFALNCSKIDVEVGTRNIDTGNYLVIQAMCDGEPVPTEILRRAVKEFPPIEICHEHEDTRSTVWTTIKNWVAENYIAFAGIVAGFLIALSGIFIALCICHSDDKVIVRKPVEIDYDSVSLVSAKDYYHYRRETLSTRPDIQYQNPLYLYNERTANYTVT